MSTASSSRLPVLFEKHFAQPLQTELAAYCDQHDLVAVVVVPTQEVVVYRINGQVAFRISRKSSDRNVTVVKWKPDGSLLGVAWSDGTCGVYSGENGKLLSETSVIEKPSEEGWKLDLSPELDADDDEESTQSSIAECIGWTAHIARSTAVSKTAGIDAQLLTTEDWHDVDTDDLANGDDTVRNNGGISHLTKAISTLDVTTTLPKVSAIPAHGIRSGAESNKFTSQANIDGLLNLDESFSSTIDTFVTSGTSGLTHFLLKDSVKIGSFRLPHRPIMHASHPRCESQIILSREQDGGDLHLHFIDLPLDTLSGSLLHVVASNTKRIQMFIEYSKQTIRCIQHDYTTGMQFPIRLMNNISEELEEKQEGDLTTNLTHLAMTGNFTPTLLAWLTDIVKETNHKRWDQAVNTMYANMQNHAFMNLSPALDRLFIATSVLRGHARFHEDTTKFVPPQVFTALLDDIDSLRLVSQRLQQIITTEHRAFRAFIKWLRVMIDIGVAGPGTKAANEIEERETQHLDHALILAYIKGALTRSKVADYVEQHQEMQGAVDRAEFFKHRIVSLLTRDNLVKALEGSTSHSQPASKLHAAGSQPDQLFLNIPSIAARTIAQARRAIDAITKWQSRMLSNPPSILLNKTLQQPDDATVIDVAMYPSNSDGSNKTLIVLLTILKVEWRALTIHFVSRRGASEQLQFDSVELDCQGIAVQAKSLSATQCLVLSKPVAEDRYLLQNCSWEAENATSAIRVDTLHIFSGEDGFVPTDFIVGGRPNMMVCVVFGHDGQDWRVFDLHHLHAVDTTASGTDVMDI